MSEVLKKYPDARCWWDEGKCCVRIPVTVGRMVRLEALGNDCEFHTEGLAWENAAKNIESTEG